MTDIRMPRLLDAELGEIVRLSPLKLSLSLQLRGLSTAELQLPPDAPEIPVRSFVELYDESGSVGVFRVAKVSGEPGGGTTLRLEHGLCTLRDGMVPAQSFMKPVREAISTLLDCQPLPRWTLGDVDVPADMTLIFSTEYADLFTALERLLEMLPEGYALSFDQTAEPWVLHVRALSGEIACEGRLSRNLSSVRITRDASRLCTRVYPFGAEVGDSRISLVPARGVDHADSEMIHGYGVVSRTFESDRIFDASTLYDVAALYLERHGEPETTIQVDAFDLSQVTKDDFDAFRLGRLCRLALPDADLYLTARISAIEKKDVYGMPGKAVLTLSNRITHSREADEIDELICQVRAAKLLGGTVEEVVSENRAEGTYQSPIVHDFTVEDWPDLLDVHLSFTPDAGVLVTELRIDDTYPPNSVWRSGSFNAMPYLTRDALGHIASGEHKLVLHPYVSSGGLGAVNSTVTMTVIKSK